MIDWKTMCIGCGHHRGDGDSTFKYCHYYLDTGKLRGKLVDGKCNKKTQRRVRKIVKPAVGDNKAIIIYQVVK